MERILRGLEKVIPPSLYRACQPAYHVAFAFIGALIYRFPSRKIKVIAVTGTKGKSSTVEILNAILEEAGYITALTNTIRFKIADNSTENLYKMSMPGRLFMQHFLRQAVNAGCDYAILEMTSQGAALYRNRFIDLDAFVFTNISPEHIESHGSYENYREAKLSIARGLAGSSKKNTALIVNGDDPESHYFLECRADRKISFTAREVEPYEIHTNTQKNEDGNGAVCGISFTMSGKPVHSPLSGMFNLYNILAAIAAARSQGVSDEVIMRAVEKFGDIPGRVEKIESGQPFQVIVDYAHTVDSLRKFYEAFGSTRKICVLGGTGGGRDTWKRTEMGKVADTYCEEIILTNEDPYDEDPEKIVADVAQGITSHDPIIIIDRREAIAEAIARAQRLSSAATNEKKPNDIVVLISGKGTDPYIMGPNGTKLPWSDARVARGELEKLER